MRRWLALATLVISGCGEAAAPPAASPTRAVEPARCGQPRGASPFRKAEGTRVLVADFSRAPGAEPDPADSVPALAGAEIARLVDGATPEERPPPGDLDVQRLHCAVGGNNDAHAIAKALEADVVVWASWCSAASPGSKPSAVCPRIALDPRGRKGGPSRRSATVDYVADLELPRIMAEEPLLLARFVAGLHLYGRGADALAARAFEGSAVVGAPSWADAYLARAHLRADDASRAADRAQRALGGVSGSGAALEGTLELTLGNALRRQQDLPGALAHDWRALLVTEKALGAEHLSVGRAETAIGRALMEQRDYAGALTHYRSALAIDEKGLGPDDVGVANDLVDLCDGLLGAKDYPGATEHCRRALALYDRQLGSGHEHAPQIESRLGFLADASGDGPAAVEHLRRALELEVKRSGPESEAAAWAHSNLGYLLSENGEQPAAIAELGRALAIFEKRRGLEHEDIIVHVLGLARMIAASGDQAGALERFGRAIQLATKLRGALHPSIVDLEMELGSWLLARADYGRAAEHFRRALAIAEVAPAPDARAVERARGGVARALAAQSGRKPSEDGPGAVIVDCVSEGCTKSGLRLGDLVIAFGATKIRDREHLFELLQAAPPGRPISLLVVREGRKQSLSIHDSAMAFSAL